MRITIIVLLLTLIMATVSFYIIKELGKPDWDSISINHFEEIHSFSNGLARIRVKGKYGFIDKKGNIVINPHYTNVTDFKSGLAEVLEHKKTGDCLRYLINKRAQRIVASVNSGGNESDECNNCWSTHFCVICHGYHDCFCLPPCLPELLLVWISEYWPIILSIILLLILFMWVNFLKLYLIFIRSVNFFYKRGGGTKRK